MTEAREFHINDREGLTAMTGERNMTVEWGVRTTPGGATATYGPYSTREHAEDVRARLPEGGGRIITRRVTEWVDAAEIVQCVMPALPPHTVLTEEAVASLVGQEPRLIIGLDYAKPFGRCVVTAAALRDDGAIFLDIEVPAKHVDRVKAHLGVNVDDVTGRYVADYGFLSERVVDVVDVRHVECARLMALSPSARPRVVLPSVPHVVPPPVPHVVLDDAALDRLGVIFKGPALDQQITNAVYLQEKRGWTDEQTNIAALRAAKARRDGGRR